jgi:hypothetical protein
MRVTANGLDTWFRTISNKKADVAEHPEVFHHAGLLVDEPSSHAGVPFI